MAEVAFEHPLNTVPPHKRSGALHIPNIDIEGVSNDDSDEYSTMKRLQRHLEYDCKRRSVESQLIHPRYINLQEEYIKDEQRLAK